MYKSITYSELLLQKPWLDMRMKIINRDRNECQRCFNQTYLAENVYGQFKSLNLKSSFLTFKTFQGVVERIYLKDRNGVGLLPSNSHAMLYLVKNRNNNLDDKPQQGYFVAAARELTQTEFVPPKCTNAKWEVEYTRKNHFAPSPSRYKIHNHARSPHFQPAPTHGKI
ncbi:MAG: hypothetical protein ACOVNZ_03290, partial [Crocinitomicaceae bacterium]